MRTIADTRFLDPTTREVLAEPGQALTDDEIYRLEIGPIARCVAHAARATHSDKFDPCRFWRQENGRIRVGRYNGGPWHWSLTGWTYPPPWAGRI